MAEKKVPKASDEAEKKEPKKTVPKKTDSVATEAKKTAPKKTPSAKKAETEEKEPVKKESGSATGLRIGAIICWLLAIGCEAVGILMLFGKIEITFVSTLVAIIGLLVIDLIFVIIGSLLWKKSNRIDPASKKNKVKFFLWNNMGLIACIIAFVPYIVLLLSNKNLDKKTKTIATIAAIICLLIGGACSIDYNPISVEEKNSAENIIKGEVYGTTFGKCYHLYSDCQAINKSEINTYSNVTEAIESNHTRLCKFCIRNAALDEDYAGQDLSQLATNGTVDASEVEAVDTDADDVSADDTVEDDAA